MFDRAFLKGLTERAVKTFAQSLLAVLTLSAGAIDIVHTSWAQDLSVALGATLYSVLTSLAGASPATPPAQEREVPPTVRQEPSRHLAPTMSQP